MPRERQNFHRVPTRDTTESTPDNPAHFIDRKQVEDVLQEITQGGSAATGDEFFRSLVSYLASTLQLDYALVGTLTGEDEDQIETIALCSKGNITNNITYDLRGSPCANVVGKDTVCYPDNIQQRFPDDELLVDLQAESYIGTPLFDRTGKPIGIVVGLGCQPLANPVLAESTLKIVAARASAELQRLHFDQNQKLVELALEYRVDFQELVGSLSTKFINLSPDEIDRGIEEALGAISEFAEVEHAFVFIARKGGSVADLTHEWAAEPEYSLKNKLHNVHTATYPWMMSRLLNFEPLICADVDALPAKAQAEANIMRLHGVQSFLVMPMVWGKLTIGFVGFSSRTYKRAWSSDESALVNLVGEMFANALERKRVDMALRKNLMQTDALRTVVGKLNIADNLEQIYEIAVEGITSALQADRAAVLLFDGDGVLRFKAHAGLSRKYRNKVTGHRRWQQDETKAQPRFIPDIDDSDLPEELRQHIRDEGVRACAFYPLVGTLRLFGAITIYYDTPHKFSPEEINLGKVLADNISTTIRRIFSREALLKNEELYRQFFEEDLAGHFISTPDARLVACNPAFARMFGFPSVEAALNTETQLLYTSPEERERLICELYDKRKLEHYELELRRIDGEPIHVISNVIGIFNDNDELVQFKGFVLDHTNRKQAEQQLREHAALLDMTPDAILVLDFKLGVLVWNKGAENLYGWSAEDVVGRNGGDFLFERDQQQLDRILNTLIDSGSWRGEMRQSDREGRPFTTDSRWTLNRDEDGSPKSILVVNSDITDKKKWEAELLRATKLESLGVLAGGIAHDFNNILTAIIGNLSLAKLEAGSNKRISERLSKAQKATQRAKDLTKQLLTFAKGGSPIKRTASIGDIVHDTIEFALRGSTSRCDFSKPRDLYPAEVDEGQISQVIHNLIINAEQSMPDGGTISVGCENLRINKASFKNKLPLVPGRYVKIAVGDQGTGIPEQHLNKVFDPFFTTKENGSGLGLSTSYSIVKKHQGHIDVQSSKSGTTFSVYLPASEKPLKIEKVNARKIVKGKGKVLVMDDEEIVRDITGNMLEKIGYEVSYARNGQQAIRLYLTAQRLGRPFDAVIMDLTIPGGMGGKETIAKLREIDPSVKAIVSSGYSNDLIMANYHDYGFDAVAAKPYEIKELSRILHEVLLQPRHFEADSHIN